MTNWTTLDSGKREEYATGARRDIRTGKGRYDLLPPFAIHRVAGVYERGAAKYGDRNYEKGIPLTRYLDSALRHTFETLSGKIDEDHAAQAAWNLLAFLQTQEMITRGLLPQELNDLPNYANPTTMANDGNAGGTPSRPPSARPIREPFADIPWDESTILCGIDDQGAWWAPTERPDNGCCGGDCRTEISATNKEP